jgi:hypothetical protein
MATPHHLIPTSHSPLKKVFSSLLSLILFLISVFCFLFSAQPAISQSPVNVAGQDINFRIGATFQPRLSMGSDIESEDNRIGFGVRRLRFRTYVGIGSNLSFFTQLEGSGTSVQFLDIRADFKLRPDLTLRVGRFAGAQPRSMALTLHSDIDAIDRIAIAEYWTKNQTGTDARDYGIEALYKPNRFEYRLFLHNGSNQLNYRSSINDESATQFTNRDELAVSSSIRFFPNNTPNSELGIYAGYNPTPGAWGRPKNSYSIGAHAYHGAFPGHFPIRFKADVIHTRFNDVYTTTSAQRTGDQQFNGLSGFAGYLARPDVEIFAHAEIYQHTNFSPLGNQVSLWQLGTTYSLTYATSKPFHNKISVAYGQRNDTITQTSTRLIQAQLQLYF